MTKISILLGEDDRDHQRLLLAAIARGSERVTVTIASSREEIVAAAREETFDCIVLDFNIPPYTAPEIIRDLGSTQQDAPIVVISSSEDQRVVIASIRNGSTDFVPKEEAIVGDTLWRRVKSAVDAVSAEREERRQVNRRLRNLEHWANTDPLTGIMNRRAAEKAFETMRSRNDRRGDTAFVMIDLDHFKRVNDTLGHEAGDDVLRRAAEVIKACAAEADIVARWGGEEFVVVRQSASLTDIWIWADDLRRKLAERVVLDPSLGTQTASIGVDVVPTEELTPESLCRVDYAMYLAKDSGRDRVCSWEMVRAFEIASDIASRPGWSARERLSTLAERIHDELGETQREHIGPHGRLVGRLAVRVARAMLGEHDDLDAFALAAEFHDIGKIGVPEELLALPRRLSEGERRLIDEHARLGGELARACGAPDEVATLIERHHARFDEDGAAENDTLDPASIISACDAVVAMLTERPYARARTAPQVLAELRVGRGNQFNPDVVDSLHFVDRSELLAA